MKTQNLPPVTNLQKEKKCFVRNKNTEVETLTLDAEIMGDFSKPTLLQFKSIQDAYDFYNKELFYPVFGVKLSPVLFSLNDKRNSMSLGYYAFDKYKDSEGTLYSLINITPQFLGQDMFSVMSVLVHEMAHHYQYTLGVKKGRRSAYHDKEFAEIMEKIGLVCSNTGLPGGRKTGIRMSHYIIKEGKFDLLTAVIPKTITFPFTTNQKISYTAFKTERQEKTAEQKLKVKYQCPNCSIKVWGKIGLNINCSPCNQKLITL